jgi:hypothetical protein
MGDSPLRLLTRHLYECVYSRTNDTYRLAFQMDEAQSRPAAISRWRTSKNVPLRGWNALIRTMLRNTRKGYWRDRFQPDKGERDQIASVLDCRVGTVVEPLIKRLVHYPHWQSMPPAFSGDHSKLLTKNRRQYGNGLKSRNIRRYRFRLHSAFRVAPVRVRCAAPAGIVGLGRRAVVRSVEMLDARRVGLACSLTIP